MEHRQLGRTGARVSALGFGGAPAGLTGYLGTWDARADASQREVERAIRRALERGVTYFDTAPGYGRGISEELFGRALGADRQRVFLATKTPRAAFGDPGAIRAALENSLRLLRTDHVDLLQLHGGWWSGDDVEAVLARGGLETYERLRDEGKARFLQRWIEQVGAPRDFDWPGALLGFVLSHPQVDVALVGMRTAEEVDRNADVVERSLFRVDMAAVHDGYGAAG